MPNGPRYGKVPDHVKRAVSGEIKEPQLAELASHWFHMVGGPREVAKLLHTEFGKAGPGSLARQRILEMILRATKFANERNARIDDYGLLSDDDLERELAELIAQLPVSEDATNTPSGPEQPGNAGHPAGEEGAAAATTPAATSADATAG